MKFSGFNTTEKVGIGIGTNVPSRPLEVNGTGNASVIRVGDGDTDGAAAIAYIEFGANSTSWNRHSYVGSAGEDSHLWIVNEENADIKFYANNAEKMVIKNDGNVGIGTTAPSSKLHVNGSGAVHGQYLRISNGTTQVYELQPSIVNVTNNGFGIYDVTDGLYRLVINTDGNVGIGVVSPMNRLTITAPGNADPLHIYGNGTYGIKFSNNGTNFVSYLRTFESSTQASNYMSFGVSTGNNTTSMEAMRLRGDGYVDMVGAAQVRLTLGSQGTAGTNTCNWIRGTGTNLGFNAAGGGFHWEVSGTERMNLAAGGQLKLNTYGSGTHTGTSAYKLSVDSSGNVIETSIGSGAVDGAGTANYIPKWTDGDTIGNSTIYETAGKVGIGNIVPGHVLDIDNDASNVFPLKIRGNIDNNGGYTGIVFGYENDTTAYEKAAIMVEGTSGNVQPNMYFLLNSGANSANATKSDSRLAILNSGNVGIGTTAPSTKLSVYTTTAVDGITLDGSSHPAMTFKGAGTVRGYLGVATGASGFITGTATGDIVLRSDGTKLFLGTTSAGPALVCSGYNVGIGTAAPSSLLEIGASSNTTDQLQINGPSSTTKLHLGQFSNASYLFSNYRYRGGHSADSTSLGSVGIVLASNSTSGTISFDRAVPSATPSRTTSMIIDNTGNVGIGADPPDRKFHVVGTNEVARFTGTDANPPTIEFENSTGVQAKIGLKSGHDFIIDTAGEDIFMGAAANEFTIKADGKVGIGTTAPGGTLQVSADVPSFRIKGNNNPSIWEWSQVDGGSTLFLKEKNQNIDVLTMLYGGKVGIGTPSPGAKLTVELSSYSGSTRCLILNNTNTAAYGGASYDSVVINQEDVPCIRLRETPNNVELTLACGNENSNSAVIGTTGMLRFATSRTAGYAGYGSSNTRMVILADGNVGIGTASPVELLTVSAGTTGDVVGELALQGHRTGNHPFSKINFYHGTTATAFILGTRENSQDNSGSLMFNTMNAGTEAERVRISYDGKVGIGTNAPGTDLHLYRVSANAEFKIETTTTNASSYSTYRNSAGSQLHFKMAGSAVGGTTWAGLTGNSQAILEAQSASSYVISTWGGTPPIIFATQRAEKMRIQNDGKVGIGTTAPAALLDLDSNVSWSGGWRDNLRLTSDLYPCIRFSSQTINKTSLIGNNNDGGLWFATNGGANTVGSYAMVIQPDGNVGIGTASPDQKLSVSGNIQARSGGWFVARSADNAGYSYLKNPSTSGSEIAFYTSGEKMRLLSNGNFGIGLTVPTGKLNVGYTNNVAPIVYSQGSEGLVINATRHDGSNYRGYVDFLAGRGSDGTNGGASMRFFTQPRSTAAPIQALTLQYDGKVGIGTTAPGAKLDVYSSATRYVRVHESGSLGDLQVVSDNGTMPAFAVKGTGTADLVNVWDGSTEVFTILDGGNVGIGTPSPGVKLDIVEAASYTPCIELNAPHAILKMVSSGAGTGYMGMGGGYLSSQPVGMFFRTESKPICWGAAGSSATHMTLTTSGNFGIGETAPAHKLSIGPTASAIHLGYNSTAANYEVGRITSNSYDVDNAAYSLAEMVLLTSPANGYTGSIQFRTNSVNSTNTRAAVRVTILADGKVGIGTTAPIAKLHVSNAGAEGFEVNPTGGTVYLTGYNRSGGAYAPVALTGAGGGTLTLGSGGASFNCNLGIGTTAPSRPLSVYRSSAGSVANFLHYTDASNFGGLYIDVSQSTDIVTLNNSGSHGGVATDLQVGGTSIMYLKANGYVGVGTNAPSAILHVYKSTNAFLNGLTLENPNTGSSAMTGLYLNCGGKTLDLRVKNAASGNIGYINSSGTLYTGLLHQGGICLVAKDGNVGIGTTAPDSRLEVKGAGGGTGLTFKTTDSAGNTGFWAQDGGKVGVHYYPFVVNQDYTDTACPASTYVYVHGAAPFIIKNTGHVGVGLTTPQNPLEVALYQSNSTLTGTSAVHFGGPGHTTGQIMGITLGYRGDNDSYRKVGIVAAGLSDSEANQDFHILVNTASSAASCSLADKKLSIYGATGYIQVHNKFGIGVSPGAFHLNVNGAANISGALTGTSAAFSHTVDPGTTASALSVVLPGVGSGTVTNQYAIKVHALGYNNSSNVYGVHSTTPQQYLSPAYAFYGETSGVYGNVYGLYTKATQSNLGGGCIAYGIYALATSASSSSTVGKTYGGYFTNTASVGAAAVGLYVNSTNGDPLLVDSGGSRRLTVKNNGNVGIGTASPNQLLTLGSSDGTQVLSFTTSAYMGDQAVIGNIEFSTHAADASYKQLANIYALKTGTNTNSGALTFWTKHGGGRAERVRIAESGSVGIGTTAPATTLDVNGITTFRDYLKIGAAGVYGVLTWNGGLANTVNFTGASGKNLSLGTNGAYDKLVITTGGKVGIGTVTPEGTLHVCKASAAGLGGQIVIDNPAASNVNNKTELSFLTDSGASGINIRNARIVVANENASNGAANMQFHTWNGSAEGERMRISAAGAATFNGALTVSGTANLNGTVMIDGGNGYFVDGVGNSYNTGWGATSDDHSTWINFYGYQGGTTKYRDLRISDGKNGLVAHFDGSSRAVTFSGTVTAGRTYIQRELDVYNSTGGGILRFFSDDNVSISKLSNESSPYKGYFTSYASYTPSGAELLFRGIDGICLAASRNGAVIGLRMDANGKVGIGTTAPAAKLHVHGGGITLANNQILSVGTGASNSSGKVRLYGANANDFYMDWMALAPERLFRFAGKASTSDYMTYFTQAGTGKHNLWVSGTLANAGACTLASGGATSTFGGCVGIGTNPGYMLQVNGSFAASSKSFVIDHPLKPHHKLEHGALEGPEFGVYYRGRAQSDTITLPDYWVGLVREGTVTVQLTPNGSFQHLYVVSTSLTEIKIGAADGETIDCYYTIYGERADLDPLVVEKIV